MLLAVLVLVLGAAVWFASVGTIRSDSVKMSIEEANLNRLYRVKEKMLMYAMFQPEIFRTLSSKTTPLEQKDIPGPGYFPCPDIRGDGVSDAPCGAAVGFVTGVVPLNTSSRLFDFIENPVEAKRFWYAVDSRFLTQNRDYYYDAAYKRFVPLNHRSPATANLTLDGVEDIVMVLIYSGVPLLGQDQSVSKLANIGQFLERENADGGANFVSVASGVEPFNDLVISITLREWRAAMLSRVGLDLDGDGVADLCVDPATAEGTFHWFNECFTAGSEFLNCALNTDPPNQNLYGQGWRAALGCP